MAEQINIFVENRPGRLKKVTGLLSEAGINIRAMVIQDRGDFGVMKLLVDDPYKAQRVLSKAGLATALRNVLAVVIEDRPGGLHKLAGVLDEHGVNVLDGYGFVIASRREAVWCIEVEETEETRRIIEAAGFRILEDSELYQM